MDAFNPTTKTQQAISSAAQAATVNGNPDIKPVHLLGALLAQSEGLTKPLLQAVGSDPKVIAKELEELSRALAPATGSTGAAPPVGPQAAQAAPPAQPPAPRLGGRDVGTRAPPGR